MLLSSMDPGTETCDPAPTCTEPMAMPSLRCQICNDIISFIQNPESGSLDLGKLLDDSNINCKQHSALIRSLRPQAWAGQDKQVEVKLSRGKGLQSEVTLQYSTATTRAVWRFTSGPLLVTPSNETCLPQMNARNLGRGYDAAWIDPALLRSWKETCDIRHGHRCTTGISSKLTALKTSRPILLLDVHRNSLVDADSDASYVALSYVWGGTSMFRCLLSNVNELKQDGALDPSGEHVQVPQTIRAAMRIVKALGERFLWVDALCIIQDDDVTKGQQINNMAGIYLNARLTIIAADGDDADSGLKGVPGLELPRNFQPPTWDVGSCKVSEAAPADARSSRWAQRGWTWQESMFSLRTLTFTGTTVYWECSQALWREDSLDMLDNKEGDHGVARMAHTVPDLAETRLNGYNERALTFPEDIIDAYAGKAKAMSQSLPTGFISGLPTFFFHICLLWRPENSMTRRNAVGQGKSCLPSWSWVGWNGKWDLRWEIGTQDHILIDEHGKTPWHNVNVVPLVEWHEVQETGAERMRIAGTAVDWMHLRDNVDAAGPPGWKRFDNPEAGKAIRPGSPLANINPQPRCYWQHQAFGDAKFCYPVPIFNPDGSNESPMKKISLISGRTRAAFATAGNKMNGDLVIHVRNDNKEWLGVLELHEAPTKENGSAWGCRLELIEMSQGETFRAMSPLFPEQLYEERPKPLDCEKYEFYFVMWVVRGPDDIAYRRGIGRVVRQRWDALKPQPVDIILG
ncbi:uncharacterized protein J7T55_007877 [Diaporthe amygdali]|uniref:uncharacterized protein n=1 Tax=Phomopsis amygdali TaxID=1214568 RepID=UPI0022FE36A8|nr:uncharacterized protein J7T55_007877 [Diaporthe amygdali]KAJ0114043.1 uncharacterized protein J7T55_007877 [Diaporthe amygdali]